MSRTVTQIGIDSHGAERDGEGNATYTRNLLTALLNEPAAERFVLFAGDAGHPFYRHLLGGRASTVAVTQGGGIARLGWSLARAARRQSIDALHVQYAGPLGYRRPLVVTVHDLSFLHYPESFPRGLRLALRVLVPRTIARAARVIAVSEFTRQDIIARYGTAPDKVRAISESAGIGFHPMPAARTAEVLARYGVTPGFVFSLGRLNRRKNLERLIVAHARVLAEGKTDAPLVVGGKPDHGFPDTLRAARRSGTDRVRWVGLIPDADLPYFFSGAACFVYPSLFEGFGLPVLEAMSCGTPVVTSDRTALPELAGAAGLLVDPESVDALTEAIRRVLTDESLAAELGRRGLERSRRFSWSETARRTLTVYREALGQAAA